MKVISIRILAAMLGLSMLFSNHIWRILINTKVEIRL